MSKFTRLKDQIKQKEIKKPAKGKKSVEPIKIEDFKKLNNYNPARNPQQLKAHKCKAPNVLVAGDAGGGKTAWLCNSLIHHCLKYPKARVLLLRQTFTSLQKTTLIELIKWLPLNFINEHNKKEQMIFFTNGSCLIYDGFYDAEDKLKSIELSAWGIDQAEFLSERLFGLLNSRLRLNIKGVLYQAFLTSNPCPGFLREKFVKGKDKDFIYIPAIAAQNPFLPDGYLDRLEKLPYEMRQILRNRDWDFIQSQNCFYEILEVDSAMKRKKISGKKSVGIDVGRGRDESCIAIKEGNYIQLSYCQITKDTMNIIPALENLRITKDMPIGIDVIGVGGGLADRLKELGYSIIEINGSERANDSRMFTTRKAEILWKLRQDLPALSLEKDKKLREQMREIIYRVMNDNRISSETIREIRKSGRESPDRLIAISLANVVSGEAIEEDDESELTLSSKQWGILKGSLNKLEEIMFDIEKYKEISYIEKNEKDLIEQREIGTAWRLYRREYDRLIRIFNRVTESGRGENNIWLLKTRDMSHTSMTPIPHLRERFTSKEDNLNIDVNLSEKLNVKKEEENSGSLVERMGGISRVGAEENKSISKRKTKETEETPAEREMRKYLKEAKIK